MKYVSPEVELIQFNLLDVIQTSGVDPENPGNTGNKPVTGDNQTDIG